MSCKVATGIAGVLLSASATLGVVGQVSANEVPEMNLAVAGNLGITTQSAQLERPFWTKSVPELFNGRVNVRFRPWNEMGLDGSEVIRLVSRGTLQAGTTQLGFIAGEAPIVDGTDLAGLSPDIQTLKASVSAFEPTLDEYFEESQNVKVLGYWSFQGQVLFCANQLNSLADLEGRRIRVSGASQTDFIEHFGAEGVSMAWGEVQQALQMGALDCAITGSLGGYSGKWHEAANYIHELPINWGTSVMVMNRDTWGELGQKGQDLLQAEVDELAEAVWEQNLRENEYGISCNTGGDCPVGEAASMTLVEATEKELDLRREALEETVLPRWAERCGEQCVAEWNESVGDVLDIQAKIK